VEVRFFAARCNNRHLQQLGGPPFAPVAEEIHFGAGREESGER
jgi:hypothetical protein